MSAYGSSTAGLSGTASQHSSMPGEATWQWSIQPRPLPIRSKSFSAIEHIVAGKALRAPAHVFSQPRVFTVVAAPSIFMDIMKVTYSGFIAEVSPKFQRRRNT